MATKTGLLRKKTVVSLLHSLLTFDNDALFATIIDALKTSPQFQVMLLIRRNAFLELVTSDDSARAILENLVCSFAKEYSEMVLKASLACCCMLLHVPNQVAPKNLLSSGES